MNARSFAKHERSTLIRALRAEAKRLDAKRIQAGKNEEAFHDKNVDGLLCFSFPDLTTPIGWDQRLEDGELTAEETKYLESLSQARRDRHKALEQQSEAIQANTNVAMRLEQDAVKRHNKVFDFLEFAIGQLLRTVQTVLRYVPLVALQTAPINASQSPLEQRPQVQATAPTV